MKPSQRILEIVRANQILDGKKPSETLTTYEAIAIAKYLDERAVALREPNTQNIFTAHDIE